MFKRLAQLFGRQATPPAEQSVDVVQSAQLRTLEIEEILLAGLAFLDEQPQFADAERGKALAHHLQGVAIELAMQRATEQSTDMWQMFLIAAKVALLSYGPNATALERFEHDLGRGWVAEDYENFKLSQRSVHPLD